MVGMHFRVYGSSSWFGRDFVHDRQERRSQQTKQTAAVKSWTGGQVEQMGMIYFSY